MSLRFDGQTALITGAGKGLGRAYAMWLAGRGAALVVNNRTHPGEPSSAQAVAEEIRKSGGRAIADEHNVEDEVGAGAMIDAARVAFGKLDILICNAGVTILNVPFQEMRLDELRRLVDINLWGTIYPVHAAFGDMLAQGYGRVILTTSQIGLFGRAGASAYATSKSALTGLARSLGAEGASRNVRVNVIAPAGYTRMSTMGPEFAELLAPAKVAPVVGWLASESCNESGLILNSGAGRVRRVATMENGPFPVPEMLGDIWPQLADMSQAVETRLSFETARVLMPEVWGDRKQ